MSKSPKDQELEATKSLMSALVRMKPKPHEEMKIGKKAKAAKRKKVSKRGSKS
jgi:hypothetical protein